MARPTTPDVDGHTPGVHHPDADNGHHTPVCSCGWAGPVKSSLAQAMTASWAHVRKQR